jgi:ArsR family transcriptional regulator
MAAIEQATELLQLFAEPTRLRLLALLADHELTVSELVAVTELAQSRVSTHLGRLKEAGLVRDRRMGTSSFYRVNERLPEQAGRLWQLLEVELGDEQLEADAARAAELIAARSADAPWPELVAGEMERHYSPGRTWEAACRVFAGMLRFGDVLDIGSGDGALAELVAPGADSLLCVDSNPKVVAAASARLAGQRHVRCVCADMHELPMADASFDQVLMLNVLTSSGDPARALREAARVLRPSGQLAIATLGPHDRLDVAAAYGHVQPGFDPSALRGLLREAGLSVSACEVTSRERRAPRFSVISGFAAKTAHPSTRIARKNVARS